MKPRFTSLLTFLFLFFFHFACAPPEAIKKYFPSRNHTKDVLRQLIRNRRVKVFRDHEWEDRKAKGESSFRFKAIRVHRYSRLLPEKYNMRAADLPARTAVATTQQNTN
eukprot:TRINITY_DN2110_c0_g1_i3.p2 TRINITY_DN2110_c0_g1~~TRINITY_DN2110_c0_g1_i3.p2  ORF type:complete len:109 (+),score=28.44 TRINITY_DN2110_c0_g1_i3:190-516(+)